MQISRRRFIAGTACSIAATAIASTARAEDTLVAERRRAAHRTRRIIFNNDGDDAWYATAPTAEAFLATRLAPCVNTQVDTVTYCTTADTGLYTHRSNVAELFTRPHPGVPISSEVRLVERLAEQGTDVLEIAVDFLHRNGKEVWWSHRMNGMEDMVAGFLLGSYKAEHPEWWLGAEGDDRKYPPGDHRHWYRVLDYGVPQVREHVLSIIGEVIENYDIDGVELDYLRDPWLFRETFSDPIKAVTEEHCHVMVDFHRQVRSMLDAKAKRIGRPLLQILRVPKWPELSRFVGLDIEANLRSGAVDVLVGSGGYTPFAMPPVPFIELAHRYHVPAYVCISRSGMKSRGANSLRDALPAWRGAAMNLWDAGADGQYIFNTMPNEGDLPLQVMREIGDPGTLDGREMLFCLNSREHLAEAGWTAPVIKLDELLPIALKDGATTACEFYVGTDVTTFRSPKINLRLFCRGTSVGDSVTVLLNGAELATISGLATAGDFIDVPVGVEQVRYRTNQLGLRLRRVGNPREEAQLVHFELTVSPQG